MVPTDLGLPPKFSSWRKYQYETVMKIVSSPKRFILVNAPPGSGKTITNICSAILTGGRCLYLIGSKGLQEQVMGDVQSLGAVDVRGHGNYSCGSAVRENLSPRNLIPSMEQSDTIGPACYLKPWQCHYQQAITGACQSSTVVSNYAFWLTLERFDKPLAIGKFDMLVLDEAHSADDWLSRYCAFSANSVDMNLLLQLPLPTANTWVEWVTNALVRCVEIIGNSKINPKIRDAVTGVYHNLSTIASHVTEVDWIVEGNRERVKLTPVWAHAYSEPYLFRDTRKVILSSATITPDTARYLGIPDTEFEFLEVPSTFDPRKRPFVYVSGCGRIDHRTDDGRKQFIVNVFDRFMELWQDYKGIIQSRSYDWTKFILSYSRHTDWMISNKRGESVDSIVSQFRQSTVPSVLVSPSVTEGYDFIHDDARWQIIVKVPFPDSRDIIVKARCEKDKEYRNYLAAQSLLQQYGRTTRSTDDWSMVIIVDEHWWQWFKGKAKFPAYFRAAWQHRTSLPTPKDMGVN